MILNVILHLKLNLVYPVILSIFLIILVTAGDYITQLLRDHLVNIPCF